MQTPLVLGVIGFNLAIALLCGLALYPLLRLRDQLTQWRGQLDTLNHDLQEQLPDAVQSMTEGRQQLQQGRQNYSQQQAIALQYVRWIQQLIAIWQWVRLRGLGSGKVSTRTVNPD